MTNQKSNESDTSTSDEDDEPPNGPEDELQGSTTKYLQDEVASDEGTSPLTIVPETQLHMNSESASAAAAPTPNKEPKYIEVEPIVLGKVNPKSQLQSEKSETLVLEEDNTSVNYARLKPNVKASRSEPTKIRSEASRSGRGELVVITTKEYLQKLYIHV